MSEPIDAAAAYQALRAAAGRTAGLLKTLEDPGAAVPELAWTAGETAAHLVAELQHYAGFASGERDAAATVALAAADAAPSGRSAIANAAQLEEFTERDPARLADMLVPAADEFIAAAGSRGDEPTLTPNGLHMTAATMATALLGEQLIHGLDLARALKRPWPISRADALQVIAGVMVMVPDYLDRRRAAGLHVSYELRFRGGPRYRVSIDDGKAAISAAGEKVDCWISADPVGFLLVGYGRTGQWGQIARGKILAGGRKPWLGLAFGGLITGP